MKSRFWISFRTWKLTFWFNFPLKMRKVCVLRASLKSTILKKKFFLKSKFLNVKICLKSMPLSENFFAKGMFSNENFFILSDFDLKFSRLVRFWHKKFTTSQILSVLLFQFASFSCVHQNRARFGNLWMYGVCLVSQVILLG